MKNSRKKGKDGEKEDEKESNRIVRQCRRYDPGRRRHSR